MCSLCFVHVNTKSQDILHVYLNPRSLAAVWRDRGGLIKKKKREIGWRDGGGVAWSQNRVSFQGGSSKLPVPVLSFLTWSPLLRKQLTCWMKTTCWGGFCQIPPLQEWSRGGALFMLLKRVCWSVTHLWLIQAELSTINACMCVCVCEGGLDAGWSNSLVYRGKAHGCITPPPESHVYVISYVTSHDVTLD